ncbi:deoxynucleoside kinase [Salisediminibacterium beveridgei]|uniref:Deoxyadenosine kinase / Deoxyguanosine kinase n=1 Tax=Salisediminibacterium beveridgei TaxID=632773 RepID=A0A1D7QV57_9BACI|nr:deoxynucleoside kinase [Salisediminibacterium beveridgei]AOM82869.1 Deoxyadenosine kinase / Deoxyguanosine kinase [Salisediminibacterium beveridgei]
MSNHFDAPFIAVEGPIGVGKTSLATKIAEHYQYELLKEIVDENPFLSKFYEDNNEWSFQTEMFFLCNRFKQLEDTNEKLLQNGQAVVSDYHIFKNHLFAKQTLKQRHFEKYDRIYSILTDGLPTPNLIVYLNASLPTLLDRIKKRGRSMEQSMDPDYLAQLSSDYQQFMKDHQRVYPHVPVLSFNGDEIDFVKNTEDFKRITDLIDDALKTNTNLF